VLLRHEKYSSCYQVLLSYSSVHPAAGSEHPQVFHCELTASLTWKTGERALWASSARTSWFPAAAADHGCCCIHLLLTFRPFLVVSPKVVILGDAHGYYLSG